MDIFSGKIVIVTGAASGIGKVLSEEMARRGAYLIMADLNGPLLDEAVEAIKKAGGRGRSSWMSLISQRSREWWMM